MTVTGAGSQWTTTTSQLVVGLAGNGTLNVENGATVVAQSGIILGNNAGSFGTLNISGGGILETTGISFGSGTRQMNFDNATVRALANNSTFLGSGINQTNIAAGGLTVDTNGFTVRALGLVGVGGLTKIGAGTLTLGARSTYTGATVIQQGTLALAGPAASATDALASSSRVVANATFDISAISGAGSHIQSLAGTGTVTLGAKDLIITNANDTFAGAINGTGGLTITNGTQALSGANTYSGATTVTGGTLQIGNGGTSGSIIGNVTNNGTFAFNRSNQLDFAATITGNGVIRQIGSGLTNLSGDNSAFTGTTSVEAGTLAVNGNLRGTLNVLSAGRLQGIGTVGTTTNAGVIGPGNSIGTLTVAGNYTGNGGALELETVLGGDASATDHLVVTGNTAGSTTVRVLNRGGAGAPTANGIKVIDVAGASNGIFALQGDYVLQGQQAVVAGAYAYTLQKNGVSTPTDGDWYLRSSLINPPTSPSGGSPPPPAAPAGPLYQAGVPLYENYGQVLLSMNQAPSLQQRVGNRYWGGSEAMARAGVNKAPTADGSWTQSAFWGRIEGGQSELRPSNTTGSTYNADEMKAQVGLDGVALDNDRGRLIVGLTAQYGLTTAYINSFFGNGRIRAEGTSVGATATWYGHDGFYVDGQAQTMFYRSDLSSALVGSMTHGNEGFGYTFSVEGGKRIAVGNGFSLTPQAQLSYAKVDFDAFADRFGALVSLGNADSLLGRVGLSLNHQNVWNDGAGIVRSDVYAIGNLHYEFLNGTRIDVAGTGFANANDRLWGSIGGGGTYSWASGRYAVFGEITYRASLEDAVANHSYKGTGGFRITW